MSNSNIIPILAFLILHNIVLPILEKTLKDWTKNLLEQNGELILYDYPLDISMNYFKGLSNITVASNVISDWGFTRLYWVNLLTVLYLRIIRDYRYKFMTFFASSEGEGWRLNYKVWTMNTMKCHGLYSRSAWDSNKLFMLKKTFKIHVCYFVLLDADAFENALLTGPIGN